MIKRTLFSSLQKSLTSYPITAVIGPRQSGKTTLVKELKTYRYVSLENPDTRDFAQSDPKAFLEEYNNKVIFDEVQRVPELFSYLQGVVDGRPEMGQFILSGSQNFQLMERITQSLAGRVDILQLYPLDIQELKSSGQLPSTVSQSCTTGFYPAIYDRSLDPDRYYANYITTYVNRDVTELINIQNNSAFRRCLRICATRSAQLVNYNDMARDVGVSHTTLRNWLSILETSFIIYLLPPFYKNFSKRITKSPKLYFYDVGILCHLLRIKKNQLNPQHKYWGSIFENLIISEMIKKNAHQSLLRDFWFWRDTKGHEVDLLYEEGGAIYVHEIKASTTIKSAYFKNLVYFDKISEDTPIHKNLIYSGSKNQSRSQVKVVSWLNI